MQYFYRLEQVTIPLGSSSSWEPGNSPFQINSHYNSFHTAESAFLFRYRDHPVTVPSLGVLNGPTSLIVLDRSKASLTVLSVICSKES